MLTSLNRHLEMANQTRRIVFEALAYPAVISSLAAMIITLVFLFIVPQFKAVIKEMLEGSRMNPVTTFIFSIPENIVPFWIGVGLAIAVIVFAVAILSSHPAGRRIKESIILKIPVFGRLYHSSTLCKMAESMAMMVATGCDIPGCLRLASGATGSEKLFLESDTLACQIERGENILEAGQFCQMIPRLYLYSIQLGTQRNELQDNLYSLGQMYAEQTRCRQTRLQSVLLPVMIVLVGIIIAVTILAMFLPMVQIITGLSS